jgi:methionyl-tRNA formyltransferase
MRVEREMDAGPVALVRETAIDPRETAGELTDRLAVLAAEAITAALDRIAEGTVTWTEQDASRATVAPRITKEDTRLDWSQPTRALVRRILALSPRPGAYTELPGADAERLRILRAEPSRRPAPGAAPPGTVHVGGAGDPHVLEVATGDGWLAATEVQRSGSRAMDASAFLRGYALAPGARLGVGATGRSEATDG